MICIDGLISSASGRRLVLMLLACYTHCVLQVLLPHRGSISAAARVFLSKFNTLVTCHRKKTGLACDGS